MSLRAILPFFLLTATLCACTREGARPDAGEHLILVTDWRNDVVHVISMEGTYEGDLLDASRFDLPEAERHGWREPRGVLLLDDPTRFWIVGERGLSQWHEDGRYDRTLFADTALLEEPSAIDRIGNEVFVLSEDKKSMLVFGLDGSLLRQFGAPYLDRAKDFAVGPDGSIYVAGSLLGSEVPGLVSVWDRGTADHASAPLRYHVPADLGDDGTFWAHSLAFDDDGHLLITEFSRGRVERWSLDQNRKLAVLVDSEQAGKYLELERGPDGSMYLTGPDGIYRFDSRATSIAHVAPFFDAHTIADRYGEPFSPSSLTFVPRSALARR